MTSRRNPRREARRLLQDIQAARALAPSRPADLDPRWCATDTNDASSTILTPIPDGMSPGDVAHPKRCLYMTICASIDRSDPDWHGTTFDGASLEHRRLLDAGDPYATGPASHHAGCRRLQR